MKRNSPFYLLSFFLSLVLLCSGVSCSSTNGIDDYFTFNLQTSHSVTADNSLFAHQPVTIPVAIAIDSAALAQNGTSFELLKSVKLTSLKLISGNVGYPFSKIDTLIFSVQADSFGSQILAMYSGANDIVTYTQADYARFVKGKNATFMISMSTSNPPSAPLPFTVNVTNVLTARPLQ